MNGEALIRYLGSLGAAGVAAAAVWLAAVAVAFGYARSGRLGRGLRLGLELGLLGVVLLGARDLAWMVLAIRALVSVAMPPIWFTAVPCCCTCWL